MGNKAARDGMNHKSVTRNDIKNRRVVTFFERGLMFNLLFFSVRIYNKPSEPPERSKLYYATGRSTYSQS